MLPAGYYNPFHPMSWLTLNRKPEPEVMDDREEVASYASAAAKKHLDAVDNTLVEQILSFNLRQGRVLDVGSGPGAILLKLARHRPGLALIGVDFSARMTAVAREAAAREKLQDRVLFLRSDAARLPFPGGTFDLVFSNSLLHHLRHPLEAFNEMARVARPQGTVLLRDLRRPARPESLWHVHWHGRHYSGLMRKLFEHSVWASYTASELRTLLRQSELAGARIFFHRRTHLGFVLSGQGGGEASSERFGHLGG